MNDVRISDGCLRLIPCLHSGSSNIPDGREYMDYTSDLHRKRTTR